MSAAEDSAARRQRLIAAVWSTWRKVSQEAAAHLAMEIAAAYERHRATIALADSNCLRAIQEAVAE